MQASASRVMATPIPLVYQAIEDPDPQKALDNLRALIQSAIQLEFTTIPPYLSALYSIMDKSSDAYQAVRSVVVEEMFHLNQAANLLIGVGGRPKLTGDAVPTYPCFLPSASQSQTPFVGLYRASLLVFQNVFIAIEMPAPFDAPAQGQNFQTIGQFYKAIELGLEYCVHKFGPDKVFKPAPGTRPRTDIYLGKFGGRAVVVDSLERAKFAIRQITEQGEGAVDPTHPLVADQPFGAYNYYGRRIDGTYGPVLGTPFELSHYFKFKRIVDAGSFPDTYPSVSNPRIADFSNPDAKKAARTFNSYYSVMLNSLEKAFASEPGNGDIYFEITLPFMHRHLPQFAELLLMTPVASNVDATIGPNAAPTFEYDADARLSDLIASMDELRGATPRQFLAAAVAPRGPVQANTDQPLMVAAGTRRPRVIDHLASHLRTLQRRAEEAGFDL